MAAAVTVFGFTSVFIVNSQCFQISETTRHINLANRVLQERIDSLRSGSGTMLFSGTSSNTTITTGSLQTLVSHPTLSATSNFIVSGTETIVVSDTGGTITIVRNALSSGILSANGAASVSSPVTVQVRLDWTENNSGASRNDSQSMVSVVSNTQ